MQRRSQFFEMGGARPHLFCHVKLDHMTKPSLPTTKHLFAVSNNQCAFPGCISSIVDLTSNTVIAEICHICADSVGGPRYDANQTDEQRHGFDNLILLCGSHHKIIDDDQLTYTVLVLRDMKSTHEAGNRLDWKVELVEQIATKLIEQLGVTINQQASDSGTNVVALSGGVVNIGVTLEQVHDVALNIYKANMMDFIGVARSIAEERAMRVTDDFLQKLQQEHPEALAAFLRPDMQFVLLEAQRGAARTESTHLPGVLVDLLVDRAKSQDEFASIVLTEAIATAPKLTVDQLDALSIVFIVKYTRNFRVLNAKSFEEYLGEYFLPFLDDASRTMARFQHMEYVGCGTINVTSVDLKKMFCDNYPHLWCTKLKKKEVQHEMEESLTATLEQIGAIKPVDDDYEIVPAFDINFKPIVEAGDITDEQVEKWLTYLRKVALKDAKTRPLASLVPGAARLFEYWESTQATHFSLTSVGIAIAHANLARRGVKGMNLSIWIE